MLKPLYKPVALQGLAMLAGTALAAVLWGVPGAVSALLGGMSIVLPSLIFAWRLARGGQASVAAFFIGEFMKVASMTGILVLVWRLYPGAHWGAVLTGLAVTLQANFLALLVRI
jgi:ATP synthase protein I